MVQRAPDFKPPLPLWNGLQSQAPLVGHVSDHSAIIWARVPVSGTYELEVHIPSDGAPAQRVLAVARESEDWCLRWEVSGLKASSDYLYRIRRGSEILWEGDDYSFETAPKPDQPVQVTLAFGSCASSESSSIWTRMKDEGADGVVLLGDTPYIDVTDLDRVRDAYRRFSSIPLLAETLRSIPFWSTWDDHDFGRNDSDRNDRAPLKVLFRSQRRGAPGQIAADQMCDYLIQTIAVPLHFFRPDDAPHSRPSTGIVFVSDEPVASAQAVPTVEPGNRQRSGRK